MLICLVLHFGLEKSGGDFLLATEMAQIVTTIIAVAIVKSIVLLNSGTVGLGAAVLIEVGLEEPENTDSPTGVASIISPLPES